MDLAAEARLLLEAGQHARADVLAEAAAEELGKLILVARVRVELAMGGGRVDWTRFWNRFIDHADKAWNAALLDQLLSEQPEAWAGGDVDAIREDTQGTAKAQREAAYMVELRERALYVGFRDGKVERPSEQIPAADAAMIVDAVQQTQHYAGRLGGRRGSPEPNRPRPCASEACVRRAKAPEPYQARPVTGLVRFPGPAFGGVGKARRQRE